MRGDAPFWRNVAIIAAAHVVVAFGLARWSSDVRKNTAQNITWLDATAIASDAAANTPPASARPKVASPTPEPEEEPNQPDAEEDEPVVSVAKSEIELPSQTPRPTLTPKPTPAATARSSATSTPKPTPKLKRIPKTEAAKATPKPSAKPIATPRAQSDDDEQEVADQPVAKATPVRTEPGVVVGGGSAKRGSQFGWYGSMLHDRLYTEWVQPTSVVASGAKMAAMVKLRIEKDGRVSQFNIIKPSGNVVVDESVAAVAKRVTQVDPLPNGLGGDYYEVKINFELNPEQ